MLLVWLSKIGSEYLWASGENSLSRNDAIWSE